MMQELLSIELCFEQDVGLARHRAREVAAQLAFDAHDQTRIATAVSEIARNALAYAGHGYVEYVVDTERPMLLVRISDNGAGIASLQDILDGRYRSTTGMGMGILGARRLMDLFEIQSKPEQGTVVLLGKQFPRRIAVPSPEALVCLARELASKRPSSLVEQLRSQNQELLQTLQEVRTQKEQLKQLNSELEDTNRGVVALLAELDERADYVKRSSELKMQFLTNMTHEFRTPVNSILSIARLLLDRYDGPLTHEQEKQITLIQQGARSLSEIIDDLLDLAKVEAGKIQVKPTEFHVAGLFRALRGMLRPLLSQNTGVILSFEEPPEELWLQTDETKVSQILRNLISNALKYTECGEVRVSAQRSDENTVVFSVCDTGIGIARADQERIFDEFIQLDSCLHRRSRGTGLGLPLSRKLTFILGGMLEVDSALGKGSTFRAWIPARYRGANTITLIPEESITSESTGIPVLVVEDNREALFMYDRYLRSSDFLVLPAQTPAEARHWLRSRRPAAIVLDVLLATESTWNLLGELKRMEATRNVPLLVITTLENEGRAQAEGADVLALKPVERGWLVSKLQELIRTRPQESVLIIDDDSEARHLLRVMLEDCACVIVGASNAMDGYRIARAMRPRIIVLDLLMPGRDGFEAMEQLKSDPATQDIPVIVQTAMMLGDAERRRLQRAAAILSKDYSSAAAAVREALAAVGLACAQGASDSSYGREAPHG